MSPLPAIDLAALVAGLPAKIDKDLLRIKLFFPAVINKTVELAANDPAKLDEFGKDLEALGGEFVADTSRLAPKKWSLGVLFGHSDPFKPAREETREFAKKWGLDPLFVEAMG